jgi:hypothetical protein
MATKLLYAGVVLLVAIIAAGVWAAGPPGPRAGFGGAPPTGECVKGVTCGKYGDCDPTGAYCVCTPESGRGGPTCAACAPGRGPPGDCRYQLYATLGAGKGAAVPAPTTAGTCLNLPADAHAANVVCINAFGTRSSYVDWCAAGGNACRGAGAGGCGTDIGAPGTSQAVCLLPGGFWGPPGKDYSGYRPCNVGGDCTAQLPAGFYAPA